MLWTRANVGDEMGLGGGEELVRRRGLFRRPTGSFVPTEETPMGWTLRPRTAGAEVGGGAQLVASRGASQVTGPGSGTQGSEARIRPPHVF